MIKLIIVGGVKKRRINLATYTSKGISDKSITVENKWSMTKRVSTNVGRRAYNASMRGNNDIEVRNSVPKVIKTNKLYYNGGYSEKKV